MRLIIYINKCNYNSIIMIKEQTKSFGTIIPFVLLIIVMTMGAAATIMMSDRTYIMANWSDFRCKVGPLFTAYLYKPSDYTGTAGEFAKENFGLPIPNFEKGFTPAKTIDEAKTNVLSIFDQNLGIKGKSKYFKIFNNKIISDYIFTRSLNIKSQNNYYWE